MEELHKRLYERVLGAELTHYLGYGKGEAPEQAEGQRRENYRNGSSKKTLLSEDGKLEIDIARDRTGEFENPPITWKLAATQFAIRFGHRFLLHSREARQRAPGGHVHGVCLFLPFPRHLYHQSRPPRRHALSRPGPDSLRLLPVAHLAHRSLGRGPADDSHHFFSLAQWSLFRAPASGPIHFPNLALRLGQRRNRLRHARGLSMRQPAGNIIQEAPLPVWANLRQRALDAAIAEINKKDPDQAAKSVSPAVRLVTVAGHDDECQQTSHAESRLRRRHWLLSPFMVERLACAMRHARKQRISERALRISSTSSAPGASILNSFSSPGGFPCLKP